MQAEFRFPDSSVTSAKIERQAVAEEVAVEEGEGDTDPVDEGEEGVLVNSEAVAAELGGFL